MSAENMGPLRVTCVLQGSVCRPPMLDSLLQATWARVHELPPIDRMHPEAHRIDIPIATDPHERFHLCSAPQCEEIGSELHWKNRRFPVEEASKLGDPNEVKRVNIAAGAEKSYRIPHSAAFLRDSQIVWYCVGDADRIRALLRFVLHVGKFAGVGKGRIREWRVEAVEPWDGFPVVRDGKPLRPLPPDWPGLAEPEMAIAVMGCVTGTYWDNNRRELCAVPE